MASASSTASRDAVTVYGLPGMEGRVPTFLVNVEGVPADRRRQQARRRGHRRVGARLVVLAGPVQAARLRPTTSVRHRLHPLQHADEVDRCWAAWQRPRRTHSRQPAPPSRISASVAQVDVAAGDDADDLAAPGRAATAPPPSRALPRPRRSRAPLGQRAHRRRPRRRSGRAAPRRRAAAPAATSCRARGGSRTRRRTRAGSRPRSARPASQRGVQRGAGRGLGGEDPRLGPQRLDALAIPTVSPPPP